MVRGGRLPLAIIAQDNGLQMCILLGHLVVGQHLIQTSKVSRHVGQAFPTNGTLIRVTRMFLMTTVVDGMATGHDDHGCGRGEQVFTTNGAV